MTGIFGRLFHKHVSTSIAPKEDRRDIRDAYAAIMRHVTAPPLLVEAHVDPESFARLQKRVETTWSKLGQEDAYWSVITNEKFRKDNLSSNINDFLRTGEGSISRVLAAFDRVGASLSETDSVMDFGCGVGRLSIPLARRAGHVLGVDISAAHLREAETNRKKLGCDNVTFLQAKSVSDIRDLHHFDLVISLIVLQHNPPPVMLEILDALCSRVKPSGYLYVQAPTYRSRYSYVVEDDLADISEEMEMHVLPQHVFLEKIQSAGLTILEVAEDDAAGNLDFRSQVVLARKNG